MGFPCSIHIPVSGYTNLVGLFSSISIGYCTILYPTKLTTVLITQEIWRAQFRGNLHLWVCVPWFLSHLLCFIDNVMRTLPFLKIGGRLSLFFFFLYYTTNRSSFLASSSWLHTFGHHFCQWHKMLVCGFTCCVILQGHRLGNSVRTWFIVIPSYLTCWISLSLLPFCTNPTGKDPPLAMAD